MLQAARALEQITNQITSLQNEAQMLINQARNLASLPYSSLQRLQQSVQRTQQLLAQAQNIAFDVQQIDRAFQTTYGNASLSASDQQLIADARTRWQNTVGGLQDAMRVQATVVGNIDTNRAEMSALIGQSQGATGALQATQAGNQLLALQAQQLADLTAVVVANGRAEALSQAERAAAVKEMHDAQYAAWAEDARENWDASPITLARLASEVWDRIRTEDWVLTTNPFEDWATKLWDFDRPYRWPGRALGTGTQIGMATGIALAHKGTGRLVVDCQTDGDLMFDAGALWVAAKYRIPMLVVMHNNRAYYNDWEHQLRMAKLRGTDAARAHIGMDLFGPEPDFATLARSMGCWGEGPIEAPLEVRGALERALAEVKKGRLALVDTITQHR